MRRGSRFSALLLTFSVACNEACTTMVAGKGATKDGSVLAAHSNDGDGGFNGNLMLQPSKDWPSGSIRPPGIPQVSHTFKYLREGYAAMNEFQVGLGESTCPARFTNRNDGSNGGALLNIVVLGEVALERARTAREAVAVMGSLAEEYGFVGDVSHDGAGESLMVIDPNEAFVFHVLPDDTSTSGFS